MLDCKDQDPHIPKRSAWVTYSCFLGYQNNLVLSLDFWQHKPHKLKMNFLLPYLWLACFSVQGFLQDSNSVWNWPFGQASSWETFAFFVLILRFLLKLSSQLWAAPQNPGWANWIPYKSGNGSQTPPHVSGHWSRFPFLGRWKDEVIVHDWVVEKHSLLETETKHSSRERKTFWKPGFNQRP
jgi:hypothetical protein